MLPVVSGTYLRSSTDSQAVMPKRNLMTAIIRFKN